MNEGVNEGVNDNVNDNVNEGVKDNEDIMSLLSELIKEVKTIKEDVITIKKMNISKEAIIANNRITFLEKRESYLNDTQRRKGMNLSTIKSSVSCTAVKDKAYSSNIRRRCYSTGNQYTANEFRTEIDNTKIAVQNINEDKNDNSLH